MSKTPFDPMDPFGHGRLDKLFRPPDIPNLSSMVQLPELARMGLPPLNDLGAVPDVSTSYDPLAVHTEALARLNSIWLCENQGGLFDPVNFPNVASEMSALSKDWIHGLDASLPERVLTSGAWGADNTFPLGRHFEALRNPLHGLKIDEISGLHGADIAQRIVDHLGSVLPASYAQQLKSLVEDIDLRPVQIAAFDARQRVLEGLSDSDRLRSISDVEEALSTADLANLRQVVDEAVATAIKKAAKEGRFGGNQLPWFLLSVLVNLIIQAAGIWANPVFEDWYRAQEPVSVGVAHCPHNIQAHATRMIVVVTATKLHLRLGPHTTQRIVATAEHGQLLYVEGTKHGWARVLYVDPLGDGASYRAWVKVKYTKPLEAETAKLIVRSLAGCTEGNDGACEGAE